jgi:hypothetical protein
MKQINEFFKNFFSDKYVLYFLVFLSVANILGYLVLGKITGVIFFIIVSYLVYNFSKNMSIVLGTALFFTNLLMLGTSVKEGLENNNSTTIPSSTSVSSSSTTPTPTKQSSSTQSMTSSKSKKNVVIVPEYKDDNMMETTTQESSNAVAMENSVPSVTEDTEGMNVLNNKKRNRIDYAATIEEAYEDLNKILGGDGIKSLTDDTQKLMTQQLQLADAMKSMTPLLENAKSMLQGFDLKSLDSLASFAKGFGGPSSK